MDTAVTVETRFKMYFCHWFDCFETRRRVSSINDVRLQTEQGEIQHQNWRRADQGTSEIHINTVHILEVNTIWRFDYLFIFRLDALLTNATANNVIEALSSVATARNLLQYHVTKLVNACHKPDGIEFKNAFDNLESFCRKVDYEDTSAKMGAVHERVRELSRDVFKLKNGNQLWSLYHARNFRVLWLYLKLLLLYFHRTICAEENVGTVEEWMGEN